MILCRPLSNLCRSFYFFIGAASSTCFIRSLMVGLIPSIDGAMQLFQVVPKRSIERLAKEAVGTMMSLTILWRTRRLSYFSRRWHCLLNMEGVAEVVVNKGDVQKRGAMFGAPPSFSSLSCSCFDSATAVFALYDAMKRKDGLRVV